MASADMQGADLMAREKIEGMKELERTFRRLGAVPQKCITPGARKGANVIVRAAKANAPVDSGDLKRGIVPKGEKSAVKGKKVYDITFDKNMNDTFVKNTKSGKRYYYPASQEYGFQLRGGGYMPGAYFMRDAAEAKGAESKRVMIQEISKGVDRALK